MLESEAIQLETEILEARLRCHERAAAIDEQRDRKLRQVALDFQSECLSIRLKYSEADQRNSHLDEMLEIFREHPLVRQQPETD